MAASHFGMLIVVESVRLQLCESYQRVFISFIKVLCVITLSAYLDGTIEHSI